MNIHAPIQHPEGGAHEPLIGLASLMRQAHAGVDLAPLGQRLLDRAAADPNDAEALLDLSIILQLKGQPETARALQAQALALRQLYRLPAAAGEERLRLLAIKAPGDLMSNTPLEFLLEGSDIALDMLYVAPELALPKALPEHDLMIVAVGPSDRNRPTLQLIATRMPSWPRPVINAPDRIARLARDDTSRLLGSVPGIVMPASVRIDRHDLARIGHGRLPIHAVLDDGDYPVIIRPIESHAGRDLARLDQPADVLDYLRTAPHEAFFITRFIDYRGADGLFRKYRIVLIDGRPFICHMAASTHWMVHYVNAGMTESAGKRSEEARIMASFDTGFASRHAQALRTIGQCTRLDYLGIDCGETADGKLLVFEIDTAMAVHAMDAVGAFAYKQRAMHRVFSAFRAMLSRAARGRQT